MIYSLFFWLFIGLILLWISGELAVKSARLISDSLGISTLFIGFAIISISTGLPEILVVLQSIIIKKPNLSLSDIIGSNFFNISLVLGIPALFINKIILDESIYQNILIIVVTAIFVMCLIFVFQTLTFFHGIILITIYMILIFFIWKTDKMVKNSSKSIIISKVEKLKNLIILFSSLAGLFIASRIAVANSIKIAQYFSFSLIQIGSTLLAIGTSLPELVLSILSVHRKEYALAIGSSFGSVLGQGGLILGILAMISPKPLNVSLLNSIIPFIFASYFIVLVAFVLKKRLDRIDGLILVLIAMAFLFYQYSYLGSTNAKIKSAHGDAI